MSVILVHNISLSYWYYREERRGSQSSTVYKYKIWAVWIYPPEVCCCFQFEMIVDLLILCSLSGLLFISHPHCLSILHWHWLCRVIMVISEFEKHFYRCCLLHDVWCHCHKYQKKKITCRTRNGIINIDVVKQQLFNVKKCNGWQEINPKQQQAPPVKLQLSSMRRVSTTWQMLYNILFLLWLWW